LIQELRRHRRGADREGGDLDRAPAPPVRRPPDRVAVREPVRRRDPLGLAEGDRADDSLEPLERLLVLQDAPEVGQVAVDVVDDFAHPIRIFGQQDRQPPANGST
jgi:hypothetical protein